MIKNLISIYQERYVVSYLDLADSGETNRLHVLAISPVMFAFGFLDFIVLFILHYNNIREYLISFIYFGLFTFIGAFTFFYSRKVKKLERNKAYFYKTIPVCMLFSVSMIAAVYNFYILKHPFNGFLVYCLTGFIALCFFSMSPFPFSIGLIIPLCIMGPGIFKNFGLSGLADSILSGVLMYCVALYKRRVEKQYLMMVKKQKKNLEAKTFGNFTLLYNDKVVKFSRTKSNELLAYLVYKYGTSVNSKELISVLWGDYADSARYGNNLRNLIVDIKHTFEQLEIHDFFITEYNSFRINPEVVKCDYYDFLAGDLSVLKSFTGEFLSQYSWAEGAAGFLEMKAAKQTE